MKLYLITIKLIYIFNFYIFIILKLMSDNYDKIIEMVDKYY